MTPPDPPPRRLHARHPCGLRIRLRVPGLVEPVEGELLDVGIGGALLRLRRYVDWKSARLEIPLGGDTLEFEVRLARAAGRGGRWPEYGLRFKLDAAGERRLKLLIDAVRVRRGGSGLERDYWSV